MNEMPIREVQEGGAEVVDRDERLQRRRDDQIRNRADDEHHGRCGQDAPEPPGVEAPKVDASAGHEVAEQDPCNEKSGQDEEDVDADEAPGEDAETGVERDDEIDRETPQTVEIWPIPQLNRWIVNRWIELARLAILHIPPSEIEGSF